MKANEDLFKIKTNDVLPSQGKVLISEPFLVDPMFGRSVILLIDHSDEGTVGLIVNKHLPMTLNDLFDEFDSLAPIPLYKGGPIATDTLFYLHRLKHIPNAIPVSKELYLNGDFEAIKTYLLQGNRAEGMIRFFLGYAGWDSSQLEKEIQEDTWLVSERKFTQLMDTSASASEAWKEALKEMGRKYETWSRFPQVPSLN